MLPYQLVVSCSSPVVVVVVWTGVTCAGCKSWLNTAQSNCVRAARQGQQRSDAICAQADRWGGRLESSDVARLGFSNRLLLGWTYWYVFGVRRNCIPFPYLFRHTSLICHIIIYSSILTILLSCTWPQDWMNAQR